MTIDSPLTEVVVPLPLPELSILELLEMPVLLTGPTEVVLERAVEMGVVDNVVDGVVNERVRTELKLSEDDAIEVTVKDVTCSDDVVEGATDTETETAVLETAVLETNVLVTTLNGLVALAPNTLPAAPTSTHSTSTPTAFCNGIAKQPVLTSPNSLLTELGQGVMSYLSSALQTPIPVVLLKVASSTGRQATWFGVQGDEALSVRNMEL